MIPSCVIPCVSTTAGDPLDDAYAYAHALEMMLCDTHTADEQLETIECENARLEATREQTSDDVANVPRVFFSCDFSLARRETFEYVDQLAPTPRLLEQCLRVWLYFVETEHREKVLARARRIMEAIQFASTIDAASTLAYAEIARVRRALAHQTQTVIVPFARVQRLDVRRRRLARIIALLETIDRFMATEDALDIYLDHGDQAAAVRVLQESIDVYHSDLAGIACTRDIGAALVEQLEIVKTGASSLSISGI